MIREDEYGLLLSTLPGMAYRCSVGAPWTLHYVSPGVRFVTSVDRQDLLSGRIPWASLIHCEDLTRVEDEVSRAVSERSHFTPTYRLLDPDRGERWVVERGKAVYDEEGKATALIGFISDITEQKQVEDRLRKSEEHFRAAVELNPQIPWTADPGGIIGDVGPKWLEMLGDRQVDNSRHGWAEALHPDDQAAAVQSWKLSLATGKPLDIRYRLRLKDGSFRWSRARAAPRYEDRKIVQWYGTLEDIQEQAALEAELRQAEERYALAAKATGDVIWDWNIDEGIIRRIASSGSMFGYSAGEFACSDPETWQKLVHPEDVERMAAGVRRIIAGFGDRWSDYYRLRRADGSYAHVLDRGYLIRSDGGVSRRMVGAMQDVSEQKAAEDQLQRLQTDLVHLAHQSALGTMAATVAHELNQPLAASANYLAGTRKLVSTLEGATKSQAQSALDEAEKQIRRAAEIIKRMRSVIAKKGGTRERASLKSLVGAVSKLMEASRTCPGLVIRSRIHAEADEVLVDEIQIEQVLLNLIRNACEAMEPSPRPEVSITARRVEGKLVEVEVRDRGRGLTNELLESLFTAFSGSTTGGLGVGLSISRTIVEAHGGRIRAQNNEEGGASLFFTIPAATSPTGNVHQADS